MSGRTVDFSNIYIYNIYIYIYIYIYIIEIKLDSPKNPVKPTNKTVTQGKLLSMVLINILFFSYYIDNLVFCVLK